MSSNDKQVVENTRERWLSTDFNDNNALIYANAADAYAAIATGAFATTNIARGGVLSGGAVQANGFDLNITVTPIIAYKVGAPPGPFDSRFLKIQTTEPTVIPLTPDPGNPKWVAIEVSPGQFPEVVSSRDIFQPALGTFTPQNVPKITGPLPVFTVNEGVPAPNPQLPAGNPDVIPLAYVYLEASATQVETLDVIFCRPAFQAATEFPDFKGGVGGLSVLDQTGAGTYLANPGPLNYTPPFRPTIRVQEGGTIDLAATNDPNFVEGEAFPAGADARIGVWLAPAPYPPGYDLDVRDNREYLDASGRIPSSPATAGFPVTRNGVYVFSNASNPTNGPTAIPNPAITAINDSTWNGGTIDTQAMVYVGSVANYQFGTSLYPQRINASGGNGVVYFSRPFVGDGQADIVNDPDPPSVSQVNGRTATYFPSAPLGPPILPVTVDTIQWSVIHGVTGGATATARVELAETGLGQAQYGVFYVSSRIGTAGIAVETIDVYLDEAGFVQVTNAATSAGATSSVLFRLRGYIDSALALR